MEVARTMVKATFQHIRAHEAYIAEVRGHAGFDELGKDVVCAGASMYAMGLAQCVLQMRQAGKLQKIPSVKIKNGEVFVVAKPKREYEAELRHYFYMAQVGFRLLETAYPDHVSLKLYETSLRDDSDIGVVHLDGQATGIAHPDGQEENPW